jgi:hypothetical protein
MGTWLNSLGPEERSQLTTHLTGTRRLLTGTLLPHLSLAPDDLKVHGLVVQLKGLLTGVLELLEDDDPEDLAVRARVESMLTLIEKALPTAAESDQ